MTAHIFPQKRKRHPQRTEQSFAPKMRSFVVATSRRRTKKYKQADSKTHPTRHFRAAPPLAAVAKTGAIFVKRIGLCCAIRYRPAEPPPSPRDEKFPFVTNCISPTALLPLHDGVRQCDCRRRHKRFSSRFFCWANHIPIRYTTRQFPHILNFRAEELQKGESAPEAA